MFVPPEQRSIPPEWEPPERSIPEGRRQGNAAALLIILISVLALFSPIAGETLVQVVLALFGY